MGIFGSKDNEGDFCIFFKIGIYRRIIDYDLDFRFLFIVIFRIFIVVDKIFEGMLDFRLFIVGIFRILIILLFGNYGK